MLAPRECSWPQGNTFSIYLTHFPSVPAIGIGSQGGHSLCVPAVDTFLAIICFLPLKLPLISFVIDRKPQSLRLGCHFHQSQGRLTYSLCWGTFMPAWSLCVTGAQVGETGKFLSPFAHLFLPPSTCQRRWLRCHTVLILAWVGGGSCTP